MSGPGTTCANHPDRERAAFCQNCGKPLCSECVRNIGSSIYCEPCYAARIHTTPPPAGVPYPGYPPPSAPSEANPGLAALLGFIPGVGAMYNGQYGKGIVHLIVFAILVTLADDVNGIFGLFIVGWIFYMVIEAHHTARARRDRTPLPNPFGLNDISERLGFGKAWPTATPTAGSAPYSPPANPDPGAAGEPNPPYPNAPYTNVPAANAYAPPYSYNYTYVPPVSHWGAPQDAYNYGVPPVPPMPPGAPTPPYPDPNLPYQRRFPAGAIWLIGLGVLFLFGNVGAFHIFPGRLIGPVALIGLAVWIFVRRMTDTGQGMENDGTPLYHYRLTRAISGSAWLALIGVMLLLDELHILRWRSSWPILLIGFGILMIVKRTYAGYTGYPPYPGTPAPPASPVTSTEIVPSAPAHHDQAGDGQEGR